MKGWTIVFDLDGTLVDTAPDLTAATNHVLATLSLAPVDEMEIRPYVGHGALAMIDGAVRAHGRTLSERQLHDLFEVFIVHYTANIAVRSQPYPGAIAAMERLAAAGAKLAVCTNKIEAHARALLEALSLSDQFAAVTGRDSLGASKPDPRHLTGTIRLAGGETRRAVMIGDSQTDIETAKAAQVPIVAVSFGYSLEPVINFAPDAVIDSYAALNEALEPLIKARVASRG